MNVFRRTVGLLTLAVVLTIGAAGCAKKAPLPAPPPPPPPPTAPAPPPTPPPPPAPPPAAPAPVALSEDEIFGRKTLDQLNAERPLADVYFDLDESTVRDDARGPLQKNADWMKRWTSTRISIEGHCDERGSRGIQPGTGRPARQRGQGLPGEPRDSRRSHRGCEQGQGVAVLHRLERGLLAAEPPRPLPDHREVRSLSRSTRSRASTRPRAISSVPQTSTGMSCR